MHLHNLKLPNTNKILKTVNLNYRSIFFFNILYMPSNLFPSAFGCSDELHCQHTNSHVRNNPIFKKKDLRSHGIYRFYFE